MFWILGGNVTVEDFQQYNVTVHEDRFVVRLDNNLRVYTVPPPSSGILVPYILKIMRGFYLNLKALQIFLNKIIYF